MKCDKELLIEELALCIGNADRELNGLPIQSKIEGAHWDNSIYKAKRILRSYNMERKS